MNHYSTTAPHVANSSTKSKSYNLWIEAGYELFSLEGPEGIQIERLARILDLNKSGFYHYFGNHDVYYSRLMDYHRQLVNGLEERVRTMNRLIPEGIQLLSEALTPILVQKQLQRASHIPLFALTFKEVNRKVDAAFLPLWSEFIEIPSHPLLALRYLEFVRDIIYARLTPTSLSFEFIFETCMEAKEICQGFIRSCPHETMTMQSA